MAAPGPTSPPTPTHLLLRTGNTITTGLPPPTKPTHPTSLDPNQPLTTSTNELLTALRTELHHARTHSHTPHSWVQVTPDATLLVPATLDDPTPPELSEARSAYDVTVKLFYLPDLPVGDRARCTLSAVKHACETLGVDKIDLLNIAFPGVGFDADNEVSSPTTSTTDTTGEVDPETASFLQTYPTLEALRSSHTISAIGLSEFGSARLSRLLPHVKIRPSVVQINVRDCCVVPRELIQYAKREGITLLTHNDSAEVLTREEVEGLLKGAHVWERLEKLGLAGAGGKEWSVKPLWVVKYTAVVRDRSVVENKGYIAMAEIR